MERRRRGSKINSMSQIEVLILNTRSSLAPNVSTSSVVRRTSPLQCGMMSMINVVTKIGNAQLHTQQTSKTPEGRSATFRVQALVFSFFLIFHFLTSIAARFLMTFLLKKKTFFLSRLGQYPLEASFFLSLVVFKKYISFFSAENICRLQQHDSLCSCGCAARVSRCPGTATMCMRQQ